MIGHAAIEDALLGALSMLHQSQNGPLHTLQASGAFSFDDAQNVFLSLPAPFCLALTTRATPSLLRPGNRHDTAYTVTLMLGAKSFRGRDAAARGDMDKVGVFDLLSETKRTLLGRSVLGISASELSPGQEWLLATTPTMVVWAQEWTITVYH